MLIPNLNQEQKLKDKEYNYKRFHMVTKARNYEKIAESTERKYKNNVTDKNKPVLLKILYDHIYGEHKSEDHTRKFYFNKIRHWCISDKKLSQMLGISQSTTQKILNCLETEGIIKRGYLYETHNVKHAMPICFTIKGRKLAAQQFSPAKKITYKENSSLEKKNYNNIYKSSTGEITFKAHGDKITAKAVNSFREITGMRSERITKSKCKWIHQVLNTLSKAFHIHDLDAILSAFRQFLKSQLAFLRKITFYTLFNLKAVMAYIWRLKSTIKHQEETPQDSNYWARIEKMIENYKNSSVQNVTTSVQDSAKNVPPEKLPENKTSSSNVKINTGPQSIGSIISKFMHTLE